MITEENKPYRRWPRAYGFVLLAVSLALAKWQIYDPLHAAESGRQRVIIIGGCFALAIVGSIGGILYVIFGSKVNRWGDKFNPENIGWKTTALYICLAMAGLALFVFVFISLSNQGFRRE